MGCLPTKQMTPEEKAIEVTKKFGYAAGTYINDLVLGIAKRSALICCDEIIEDYWAINDKWNNDAEARIAYWQLVKTHIQAI